ncbi:hypothetical protein ACQKGO_24025 [Corallococcus interemptor]|uniref:hypothetical protein n=1 Tax=Corallococcus interemptor TaxID=2316720 RepID=UPI003D08BA99
MNNALTKSATAQAAAGGCYPRFGRYLLEVEVIRTKDGFEGDSASAELKVRESEARKLRRRSSVRPASARSWRR